jgi:hypothetical protein
MTQKRCPYPRCGRDLNPAQPECGCDERNPIAVCRTCGSVGSAYANFCRVCDVRQPEAAERQRLGRSTFLFIPGSFHTAAIPYGGWLWALSENGLVHRLSPRAAAAPKIWARLPAASTAGFNRPVIVRVDAPGAAISGPVLLAVDHTAVHGVSLVDGRIAQVCVPPTGGEIVANRFAHEAPFFRTIAAGASFVCVVMRPPGGGELRLQVHSFAPGRAFEEPLRFADGPYAGPVVRGNAVGLCTEEGIWVYDTAEQTLLSAGLLSGFEPYWQRPSSGVCVPPGHVPLSIAAGDNGRMAYIAGQLRGSPGVLRIDVDRQLHDFLPARSGACVCEADGGLCINQGNSVEFIGAARPAFRLSALAPGMPVGFDGGWFSQFSSTNSGGGSHVVTIFPAGREPYSGSFDDASCNEDSCAWLHWVDGRLIVNYLVPSQDPARRGMKFARWEAA